MANLRLCSVDNCDKPHDARGYCKAHYHRFMKRGSPEPKERWPESRIGYLNSILNVDTDECIQWPYRRTKDGYGYIDIKGKSAIVSRYICQQIHGDPPSQAHQAAHSCGNGHLGCCNPKHLRWATPAENTADKYAHAKEPKRPKRVAPTKLSPQDVLEIRLLLISHGYKRIAKQFGVNPSTINKIKRGKLWRHVC